MTTKATLEDNLVHLILCSLVIITTLVILKQLIIKDSVTMKGQDLTQHYAICQYVTPSQNVFTEVYNVIGETLFVTQQINGESSKTSTVRHNENFTYTKKDNTITIHYSNFFMPDNGGVSEVTIKEDGTATKEPYGWTGTCLTVSDLSSNT